MTSLIFEDKYDGIRNICDGIRNICDGIGFSHTFYVYRHANLCSGLRVNHSPQFIKKEFASLCILPRKRHRAVSEPGTSRSKNGHSTDVLSEPLTKRSISFIIIYVTYKSSASYRY